MDTGVTCKSEEEINRWLQRKYILMLHNEKHFSPIEFSKDAFKRQATISYYPIPIQDVSYEHSLYVSIHRNEMLDRIIFNAVKETEYSFEITKNEERIFNQDPNVRLRAHLFCPKSHRALVSVWKTGAVKSSHP